MIPAHPGLPSWPTSLPLHLPHPPALPPPFKLPRPSAPFSSSSSNGSPVAHSSAGGRTGAAQTVKGRRGGEEDGPRTTAAGRGLAMAGERQSYGEVSKIVSSLARDGEMFYQIEWKDGHAPSWLPAPSIARDILAEYEGPWWKAARSADEAKLRELLQDEGRDIDSVDESRRTALLFAAGIGSEECVRLLVEAGADIDWQDSDGFSPLHISAGYVKPSIVSALLEFGANTDLEDSKGRTALKLVEELLGRVPKANPLYFARNLSLENVAKMLEEASYENAEVEQILEKRAQADGGVEYLVKWKDGSGEEWLPADFVGEDLVQDYEAGFEYAVAERILGRREEEGRLEYLVKWADVDRPTWEPSENVMAELIDRFEKMGGRETVG